MKIGELSEKLNAAAFIACLVICIPAGMVLGDEVYRHRWDLVIPVIWGIVNWLGTAAAAIAILIKYENN